MQDRSYAASPLGQRLEHFLTRLKEIRMRYDAAHDHSIEKKHADGLLEVVIDLLGKVHDTHLPKFSNWNANPSYFGLIKDFIFNFKVYKKFQTREYLLFQAIKKSLPGILNAVKKKIYGDAPFEKDSNPDDDRYEKFVDELMSSLSNKLPALPSDANAIPGKSLNEFLDVIKNLFLEQKKVIHEFEFNKGFVRAVEAHLFLRERSQLQPYIISVTHPMMFEVLVEATLLFHDLPYDIKKVMTFFNPKSVELDLSDGVLGTFLGKFSEQTYLLRHKAQTEPHLHPAYIYEFLIRDAEGEELLTIDAADYYANFLDLPIEFLLRYLSIHKDMCPANFELTKIDKMREYQLIRFKAVSDIVKNEIEYLRSCLRRDRLREAKTIKHFDQFSGLELVRELKKEMDVELVRQSLWIHFESRVNRVRELKMSDLLKDDHQGRVFASLITHRDKGINTAFIDLPLPKLMINVEDLGVELKPFFPVEEVVVTINILNHDVRYFGADHLKALQIKFADAFAAWKKEKHKEYDNKIQLLLADLDNRKSLCDEIEQLALSRVPAGGSVDFYQKEIEACNAAKDNLEELIISFEDIKESAAVCSYLDNKELAVDVDSELASELVDAAKNTSITIEGFERRLRMVKGALSTRQEELLSGLRHANEELEFQNKLRSQDEGSLRTTLINVNEGLVIKAERLDSNQKSLLDKHGKLVSLRQKLQRYALSDNFIPEKSLEECNMINHHLVQVVVSGLPQSEDIQHSSEERVDRYVAEDEAFTELLNAKLQKNEASLKCYVVCEPELVECEFSILPILKNAKECISKNSKEIPFTEIDSLFPRDFTQVGMQRVQKPGFDQLLDLLNINNNITRKKWANFRSKQDDAFRFKPDQSVTIEYRSMLIEAISNAINQHEARLCELRKSEAERLALIDKQVTLKNCQSELEVNIKMRLVHSLSQLKDAIVDLECQNQVLKSDITKLEETSRILEIRVELLASLRMLTEAIDSYQQASEFFSDNVGVYHKYISLEVLSANLGKLLNKFGMEIKTSQDPSHYQDIFEVTSQLVESTQGMIANVVEAKFSNICHQLSSLRQQVADFTDNHQALMEDPAPYHLLKTIFTLQADLRGLLDKLRSYAAGISLSVKFEEELQRIEREFGHINIVLNKVVSERLNRTDKALRDCNEWWRHSLGHLIETYELATNSDTVFNHNIAASMAPLFENCDLIMAEVDSSQVIAKRIEENLALLSDYQGDHPLLEKSFSLDSENLLRSHKDKFSRVQMIGVFSSDLSDYLQARHQRYLFKDTRLSSTDQRAREIYVGELQALIAEYVKFGKAETLLKKITNGLAGYPGLHLRTLLNQMLVAISDFDREKHSLNRAAGSSLDAFEALSNLPDSDNHKKAIIKLDEDIEILESQAVQLLASAPEDSQVITNLANQLRADVSRYVVDCAEPDADVASCYRSFKSNFTARLHSQDVMLQKHQPLWPIIANIALSVVSLGLYLPCRLIISKLYYGHASLLFSRASAVDKQIARLDKDLSQAVVAR